MFLDTAYGGPLPPAPPAQNCAGYGGHDHTFARRYLSSIVERALAMLDALDGDPDLEDDGTADDEVCHLSEWRTA